MRLLNSHKDCNATNSLLDSGIHLAIGVLLFLVPTSTMAARPAPSAVLASPPSKTSEADDVEIGAVSSTVEVLIRNKTRVKAGRTTVHVHVYNRTTGDFEKGLKANAFTITSESCAPIRNVKVKENDNQKSPTLVVVTDGSGSMQIYTQEVTSGLGELHRQFRPGSVNFGSPILPHDPSTQTFFTHDARELGGGSPILDATGVAISKLPSGSGKSDLHVVLISDLFENSSLDETVPDLVKRARSNGIRIDILDTAAGNVGDLLSMADQTGGFVIPANLGVSNAFISLAKRIRHIYDSSYEISFTCAQDKRLEDITVDVSLGPDTSTGSRIFHPVPEHSLNFPSKPFVILFEHDKTNVRVKPKRIKKLVAIANREAGKLNIDCYASSRGNKDYNFDLSERRAKATKVTLMKHRLKRTKLGVVSGHGVAPQQPDAGDPLLTAKNRRCEITMTP